MQSPQKESFLFHFNKLGKYCCVLLVLNQRRLHCCHPEFLTTAGWIWWPKLIHWLLLVIIPPDEFTWGICSLNAKLSGQDKWKMHYLWHAVSPRNVFRSVHRQWDRAVPLSHSCCSNFLLENWFCISNGYLQ